MNILIKVSSLSLLFFIIVNILAICQTPDIIKHNIIKGRIIDFETKKPVPSATIRLDKTNNGTIATSSGEFILPKGWFGKNTRIKISSIGYKTEYFDLDLRNDSVEITLHQNPVLMSKATVIGNIEVEEIIRRTIARKQENRLKYNTLQCKLYSKLRLDLDEFVASMIKDVDFSEDKISVGMDLPDKKKDTLEQTKNFISNYIIENTSRRYIDVEQDINKTIITKRRQTANLPTDVNRLSLDKFVDFTDNEIEFIDAKIITPLNDKALSYYKYELLERKYADTNYIYVIKVIPNTSVYPTFAGTISIIEGTYQLVSVNLSPSIDTKIYMVDSLEYTEVFENIGNDIWYPTYYENKATFNLKIIPFVPPIKFNWIAKSIISDVVINVPIPDSILNMHIENTSLTQQLTTNNNNDTILKKGTIIEKDADSVNGEYWNDNALLELTEEEKKIYQQVDTAAKELNIDMNSDSMKALMNTDINKKNKLFDWNYNIKGHYNRVEDYTLGADINFKLPYTLITGGTEYTKGQHRWWYDGGIKFGNFSYTSISLFNFMPNINENKFIFDIGANIFSRANTFGHPFKEEDIVMNTIDVYLFGRDYFDYYRNDGWNISANINYSNFKFNATYQNTEISSLNKSTDFTLFTKKKFRENPEAANINQQFFMFGAELGNKITLSNDNFQYLLTYNSLHNIETTRPYNIFQSSASIQFPIMETGYGKLLLYLAATGGLASKNTARHHLFVIEQSSTIFNFSQKEENIFITAYNSNLGGNNYFSFHLQLHLKDWLWRWLHLPRIKGRGLDMSLVAATARFFTLSDANDDVSNIPFYTSTANDFYTECGLRLGRIPIPGTDLLYWSIEGRAGIGKYAKGRWGMLINLNLPFGLFN